MLVKLAHFSMTEAAWRAVTQAPPKGKVQKERGEEKAEHRRAIHEHGGIQNLSPAKGR